MPHMLETSSSMRLELPASGASIASVTGQRAKMSLRTPAMAAMARVETCGQALATKVRSDEQAEMERPVTSCDAPVSVSSSRPPAMARMMSSVASMRLSTRKVFAVTLRGGGAPAEVVVVPSR